jgi:hypothetical protein
MVLQENDLVFSLVHVFYPEKVDEVVEEKVGEKVVENEKVVKD